MRRTAIESQAKNQDEGFLKTKVKRKRYLVLIAVILLLLAAGWLIDWDFSVVGRYAETHPLTGALLYVLALAASVVLFPLSSLPLLPFAAEFWGVALGGTLSALGWWLGSLLSFLLARHLARPVLRRFVSLEKVDKWKKRASPHATFFGIVLLRMAFPVEIPSFALGLIRTLSFKTYSIATLIGVLPFAYVWVALGGAAAEKRWWHVTLLLLLIAGVIFFLQRVWHKRHKT